VVSEAIVYELPIIMTDVGSAGSLIKNNINGLVVPVADQTALQTAMRSMVTDAELRFKLKQGSQQSLGQILESEQVIAIIRQRWQELIYSKTKR
jgi:glycosyltransferase involved in cell wall biosynthesis